MKIGEIHPLKIDKLTFGGDGLGRLDGVVIFVPFTAPGDLIRVKIVEVKKNFARGVAVEVEQPSPQRVLPKCEYFGKCGGCQWQHLSYEAQLSAKETLVLENIKGYFSDDTLWHPISPSPQQWAYRNRIQLKIVDNKVGYFANSSHNLVQVQHCEIAEAALSDAIRTIQLPAKKSLKLERVELSLNDNLNVHLNWNYTAANPSAFSQVNRWQNDNLVQTTLSWFRDLSFDKILDLYAGQGNFTFPLAQSFKKETIGVEYNAQAVTLANQRIQHEGLRGIKFFSGDVAAVLRIMDNLEGSAVLLDPPRAGCEPTVLRHLLNLQPKHICYISCDPTTLKRDLGHLTENGQYQITKATAFDMFPQTHHVESMVLLQRRR